MAQKCPSTSRSELRSPCLLLKKSCASILRFSIIIASILNAKQRWKSMRALHWESNALASRCSCCTWLRISVHLGHAEPFTSSTPPVYAESGKGYSSSLRSRSGNNLGGIVVWSEATSDDSRLISECNQVQCDLRSAQNGQSSLSKRSACVKAHGNRNSSWWEVAGCVQAADVPAPIPVLGQLAMPRCPSSGSAAPGRPSNARLEPPPGPRCPKEVRGAR
mmetsp:Transcript_126058/g.352988  ORF Transcript_126058/g.352988 Transcript_126058/m.352988 type:complete len:220 (+) Transcript_126058:60-719(+)